MLVVIVGACRIYMDDIVVRSENEEEQEQQLYSYEAMRGSLLSCWVSEMVSWYWTGKVWRQRGKRRVEGATIEDLPGDTKSIVTVIIGKLFIYR